MTVTAQELTSVAAKLESTIRALAALRVALGRPAGAAKPTASIDAEELAALNHDWRHHQLNRLDVVEQLTLRPLAHDGTYFDCPSNKRSDMSHGKKRDRGDAWSRVLGDYTVAPVNVMANEEFITVEYLARPTPLQTSIKAGKRSYPLSREPLELAGAYVARIKNGFIAEVEHYYDFSAILRRLGVLSAAPMGHDEPVGQPPPLVHGVGFLNAGMLQRPVGVAPGRRAVSVGSSKSERARGNVANCTAIHEAFVQHTPDRFGELIARDAVWIDMPTGAVLDGAVAAAHHDHGNWQAAFPDSDAIVDRLIANDDWVAVQHRGNGTHTGQLTIGGRSFAPTGRRMEIRVLDIVQYNPKSQAILIRNYYDTAMMLAQLGLGIG